MNFFDVNNTLVTIFNYPISWLEFVATIFYAVSVWYSVKNNVLTWPTSLVGVGLLMILFFQIQLYSDFLEQIYFFLTSLWGWYVWLHPRTRKETDSGNNQLIVSRNPLRANLFYVILIFMFTYLLTLVVANLHSLLPTIITVPASYPFLDSLTTVMSFVGTYLLIRRKIENWYLWIIVDVIAVGLYFEKGVVFLAALYFCFLIAATFGYFNWRKILRSYEVQS